MASQECTVAGTAEGDLKLIFDCTIIKQIIDNRC